MPVRVVAGWHYG